MTFVTLTINYKENNKSNFILGVLCSSHGQNSRYTRYIKEYANFAYLTLNYMTSTIAKDHMVLTVYCPDLCPVILKKNELNIHLYTVNRGYFEQF